MDNLIELENVGVRFGGLQAVDAISLAVREREVFGLLGPNGAGKTTLFNMIAGVQRPTTGRILYQGADITRRSVLWRARHGIARTFQITQPFNSLTVTENVIIGGLMKERNMSAIRAEVEEIIEYVGLAEKRNALAQSLSTGQRKRLELARALATRPRLLLLDEVTGGVDHPSIPGLVELVASLPQKGITTILIEHNMDIVSKLCGRLLFMNRGKKLVEDTPSRVLSHPDVSSLYLGEEVHAGAD